MNEYLITCFLLQGEWQKNSVSNSNSVFNQISHGEVFAIPKCLWNTKEKRQRKSNGKERKNKEEEKEQNLKRGNK